MISRKLLAATLALLACSSTYACSIEGRAGIALNKQAIDGLWIQEGFGGNVQLSVPAIVAGFTCNLYESQHWGVDAHIDYAWLGMVRSDGYATTDANYDAATKSMKTPMPLAHFTGSGHDYGFMATIEPYAKWGDWRFGVEAGPYWHNSQWSEDATNQVNYIGQTPGSSHFESQAGFHMGYVVGVTAHYKAIDASLMYFANGAKNGDPYPAIWTRAVVLTIGTRF